MRMTWTLVLTLAFAPAAASAQNPAPPPPATAQKPTPPRKPAVPRVDDVGFFAVHIGGQAGSTDLVDRFSFEVYQEQATVDVDQHYGGGLLFNIEGGVRVYPSVFLGLAITRMGNEIDTVVNASIPHPLLFDRPRTAEPLTDTSAEHGETGFHIFGRYVVPVTPALEIGVSAGPSFYRVSHDIVTDVQFQEGAAPFSTVTLTGLTVEDESATIVTFGFGANATYRVTDQVGVDGFFRYARGSGDVAGRSGDVEIDAGGAQFGVGVKFGF
jgi:Outer membrane protein beta-barrel domain